MNANRMDAITSRYASLRIAVMGDFCLDRYLEIDPEKQEISIETGLSVHNVVRVRAQPGGAGTILNNLIALGVQTLYPVGFCGDDGEGYELLRALRSNPAVHPECLIQTTERRTFTYCKPLLVQDGKAPVELNRLDSKNWTPTPRTLQRQLDEAITRLAGKVDAVILLDQVSIPNTGVMTSASLEVIRAITVSHPNLCIIGDSRQCLRGWPPIIFKMNGAELAAFMGASKEWGLEEIKDAALKLAKEQGRAVFITLAERGILGASPQGEVAHRPALPLRGEIDVVGAGDSVTANLAAALASGASISEAAEIANAAASIVVHQLGTTGTARPEEIRRLLIG